MKAQQRPALAFANPRLAGGMPQCLEFGDGILNSGPKCVW
jgi:hypothetical protein